MSAGDTITYLFEAPYTIQFEDERRMSGILACALAMSECDGYMYDLAHEIITFFEKRLYKIHKIVHRNYYNGKNVNINDCTITIHKDIDCINDETYEYANDINFINKNKDNVEGVAKLKALLHNILNDIRKATKQCVIYQILHNSNEEVIDHNYKILNECNAHIENILESCIFGKCFWIYEINKYFVDTIRSTIKLYDILFDAVHINDHYYNNYLYRDTDICKSHLIDSDEEEEEEENINESFWRRYDDADEDVEDND